MRINTSHKWICTLPTFLLVTCTSILQAQSISVSDERGLPIPFAHIQVNTITGEKAHFSVTDNNGQTSLPESLRNETKRFTVYIHHLGYLPVYDTLDVLQDKRYTLLEREISLNPVVVTAQHGAANAEKSVHKVKVIDRKRIEAQGAVNLSDVLRHETNMRVSQDHILGSSLNMQGISGENVKILIDGVPIIGQLNGSVDLSQINLNNIERIEIIEGPLSVNYGTDALAGTINLITSTIGNARSTAQVNSYYETVGQYNADAQVTLNSGKSQFQFSGGRNYFDGWSGNDPFVQFPESRPADTSRTHAWNPKEQYFGRLQYQFRTDNITFRPYIEYFNEKITNRGQPRTPYFEMAFDDYYHTERINAGANLSKKFTGGLRMEIVAAYNDFQRRKNTYLKNLTNLDQSLTDNPSDQDTSRFQLYMSRGNLIAQIDSSKLSIEIGYDIQWETAVGLRIESGQQNLGDFAIFTSAEWKPIENLILRPGIRATYNTQYNAPVVPSLHVKYNIINLALRASYARGFRAPGLKELYFEFVDINHNITGNQNLVAEQSDNFQLHLDWNKVRAKQIIKLSAGGYFNDIRNLITLAQTTDNDNFSYANIGRFQTLGFQFNGHYVRENLKFTLGGAMVGRYNSLSELLDVQRFNYSPEARVIIEQNIPKLKTSIALFYTYTGALPGFRVDGDNNLLETEISGYQMLDATITKPLWNNRIVLTFGGKNLLNVKNINTTASSGGVHQSGAGSMPVAWGRTLFTSLQIKLTWK